jgi:site-specific DNA-methyltransferase (adenine-specific)
MNADRVTVHHGDSREVMKTIADASIDSCVCDPPYALVATLKRFANSPRCESTELSAAGPYMRTGRGFMGQKWDTGETAFSADFWAEVLRVLKPGAHIVAFSGTRTYHRLACAIEDAGFEIRDQLAWLYGSGFPKSHNQKGEWEGWGTALKPALEPIVLARKPLDGTVASNVLQHGTGALNIDASRIGYDMSDTNAATNPLYRKISGYANANASDQNSTSFRLKDGKGERNPNNLGRWPANVIHDGSDEVVEAFPEAPGQQRATGPEFGAKSSVNCYGEFATRAASDPRDGGGSASRFFYSAKADAEDRLGSKHPTVKPVDLMSYLCRLVTPPGGVVLDPFAGTGTTGLGAIREGFSAILIEREAEYIADINRRLAWARGEGRLTALETGRVDPTKAAGADLPLFSGDAA